MCWFWDEAVFVVQVSLGTCARASYVSRVGPRWLWPSRPSSPEPRRRTAWTSSRRPPSWASSTTPTSSSWKAWSPKVSLRGKECGVEGMGWFECLEAEGSVIYGSCVTLRWPVSLLDGWGFLPCWVFWQKSSSSWMFFTLSNYDVYIFWRFHERADSSNRNWGWFNWWERLSSLWHLHFRWAYILGVVVVFKLGLECISSEFISWPRMNPTDVLVTTVTCGFVRIN